MHELDKVSWLQWPNVLALDAALVGAGWLLMIADALWARPMAYYGSLVLGLSIWLVYMADRWFDVRGLSMDSIVTVRHRFVKRRAGVLIWVWKFVLLATVFFAFNSLTWPQLLGGFIILLLALLHTWLSTKRYFNLPLKELIIGCVFGGSVWVMVRGLPIDWNLSANQYGGLNLFIASSLFGLLCFSNCALIAESEREVDQKMGRSSIAQRLPRKRILWAGLAVMAGLLGCLFLFSGVWGINAALALSGGALGLLGIMMEYLPGEAFRVLVDAAMLIPWLILVIA